MKYDLYYTTWIYNEKTGKREKPCGKYFVKTLSNKEKALKEAYENELDIYENGIRIY